MSGTLYLLPCPIAAGSLDAALPAAVITCARSLDRFLVEDAKTARAFLKELGHPKPMRELAIVEIGGFSEMGYQLTDMMGQEFLAPFFGSSALTWAGLIAIISYLFIGIGFNGSPHVLVRYMALRNTRDVKRIAMIGIVWMFSFS